MASTLCLKWFLKNTIFFLVKKLKFCEVWSVPFTLNFTSMWFKYLSNNVWRVKTSNVSISNGSREDFLRQIYSVQKLIFRSGFFYITTIADADIGSLMQPSKTTLNLPSSSLHLSSPLKEIRRVKIHHQFTSFPK